MLIESQRNALRAADEWNCSTGSYTDFVTYLHRAWLYLLHAEFHRDGVDYHYRDPRTGHRVKVDGEPKAWALEDCAKQRFPHDNDPVRLNLELFISLRNKIEHRYEHALKITTGGKAQASLINYEAELVDAFGTAYSLANQLRFPVFVSSIAGRIDDEVRRELRKLPRKARDLVTRFEAALGSEVLDDLRYDYRIRLVPMVGPKTDADMAINFVRLDELTEEERRIMLDAGRSGTVIVRDRQVDVAAKDKLLPGHVAKQVEDRVPFYFGTNEHAALWQRLGVRPPTGGDDPHKTNPKYCVYAEPYRSYLYTSRWVEKVIELIGSVEKYRAFFGKDPRMKVTDLSDRATSERGSATDDRSA